MVEAVHKHSTRANAEQKYQELRSVTHRSTVMSLRSVDSGKFATLTVTSITPRALEAYNGQWNQIARRVDWDWATEADAWRRKKPSYWDMAIWHKQALCGLVLGGPSRRRSRLYVEGIEANPEENPFRTQIIPVALLASEQYAKAIGCKEVWLVDPPEALYAQYEKAGYTIRLPNKYIARIFQWNGYAVKKVGG